MCKFLMTLNKMYWPRPNEISVRCASALHEGWKNLNLYKQTMGKKFENSSLSALFKQIFGNRFFIFEL